MGNFKTKDFNLTDVIDIKNQDGTLLVSSRDIAEHFEKEHRNVVRAIEDKIESLTTDLFIVEKPTAQKSAVKISELFKVGEYEHRGNKYKQYFLTKDGFSFMVMGFTGAKADQWKLKYIEAFNRMEKALLDVYHISETTLVNNFMNSVEDKLFKSIDERFEKYEENYRPTHANKIDMCNYIKNGLGEDREDGEVDLVKQRVLLMLDGEAWQDIPYKTLISNMRLIDESIRTVKSFRTKKQVSLFD